MPEWSEDYELGHEIIDHEHQRLLELLYWLERELYEDRQDMDLIRVNALIYEFTNHVIVHFLHEESLMATLTTMAKEEKEAHKADHRHWKARILTHIDPLRVAKTDLERRAHLARILVEGKNFWVEHFEKVDRQLAIHIKGQQLASQAASGEESV